MREHISAVSLSLAMALTLLRFGLCALTSGFDTLPPIMGGP
jgi:hypothetical protein